MMIASLSQAELNQNLVNLPGWAYDEARKALHRRVTTIDFSEALSLMVRIGVEAEKADHHPEWFNVYNRIDIWLTTHDAGGVSIRDIALATTIDRFAPVA